LEVRPWAKTLASAAPLRIVARVPEAALSGQRA
jgi:hypothetical protein